MKELQGNPVIFFDGVCNFCNRWINFIIKHDRRNIFKFAPLQSDVAKEMLEQFKYSSDALNSVILLDHGKLFTHSNAILKIAGYLPLPWKLFRIFFVIPSFLRNGIYQYIALNRYKWFGKKDHCMIPSERVREKFL